MTPFLDRLTWQFIVGVAVATLLVLWVLARITLAPLRHPLRDDRTTPPGAPVTTSPARPFAGLPLDPTSGTGDELVNAGPNVGGQNGPAFTPIAITPPAELPAAFRAAVGAQQEALSRMAMFGLDADDLPSPALPPGVTPSRPHQKTQIRKPSGDSSMDEPCPRCHVPQGATCSEYGWICIGSAGRRTPLGRSLAEILDAHFPEQDTHA